MTGPWWLQVPPVDPWHDFKKIFDWAYNEIQTLYLLQKFRAVSKVLRLFKCR
jgi:hypothetical protein